jgi:hypothetical protein
MKVGLLRERLTAALETAMRNREAEAIALTADRTKAMAVALAGMPDDAEIEVDALEVSTRAAATVLGFIPSTFAVSSAPGACERAASVAITA